MPRSSEKSYGIVSRWLHWLMACLVLGMIACGFLLSVLPGSWKPTVIGLHKSFGVLILILACLRLGWRVLNPPPPLSPALSLPARLLAGMSHGTLYFLMLVMPLTGWIMSSAAGMPPAFFGLTGLPALVEQSRELTVTYRQWHETLAYVLLGMIGLHVCAALYHHFIRKDDVLRRMLG